MKYYFTFGSGQQYYGCYYVIKAKSMRLARMKMFEKFGCRWSFCYEGRKAARNLRRMGLRRLNPSWWSRLKGWINVN